MKLFGFTYVVWGFWGGFCLVGFFGEGGISVTSGYLKLTSPSFVGITEEVF